MIYWEDDDLKTNDFLDFLHAGFLALQGQQVLLGFDGFVDQVASIKGIPTMDAFASFLNQRHGMSGALELLPKGRKIGGNMPITAHTLGSLGLVCTGIGTVGDGETEPTFEDISPNCHLIPVAPSGKCLALEFESGKLMLADNSSLPRMSYEAILQKIGLTKLISLHQRAKAIAYVNWSELPHMNAIFEGLLRDVFEQLDANKDPMLFDLSDCTQQDDEEIRKALHLMGLFGKKRRVILSMNHNEYLHLTGKVLMLQTEGDSLQTLLHQMSMHTGIENLVVRMDDKAYAYSPSGFFQTKIQRVEKPLLQTGAGDNYNAGILAALLMGGNWQQALLLGTYAASHYIQLGLSATPDSLVEYIKTRRNPF